MRITYKTKGTCTRMIEIDVEDGVILQVTFFGGCSGNTQGISRLVAGMKVDDVIEKMRGIDCNGRGTSCPDQLTLALLEYNAGKDVPPLL